MNDESGRNEQSSGDWPDPLADLEEDFRPEPLEPLPADDPTTIVMIGCFIGGPLWLAYLGIFARHAAPLWWALACAVLIAGFALAVARQPRSRDSEDFDDGARL